MFILTEALASVMVWYRMLLTVNVAVAAVFLHAFPYFNICCCSECSHKIADFGVWVNAANCSWTASTAMRYGESFEPFSCLLLLQMLLVPKVDIEATEREDPAVTRYLLYAYFLVLPRPRWVSISGAVSCMRNPLLKVRQCGSQLGAQHLVQRLSSM